jgi:hypothetical protein
MENYKKYISEIHKIESKPMKSFAGINRFHVIRNRPPEEIENLMNDALADLALLPLEEVNQELTEVRHLVSVFFELDKLYPDLFQKFQNGHLDMPDLKLTLKPSFKFISAGPEIITAKFMVGLYISFLNKQKSILMFKNMIQNLLQSRLLYHRQWAKLKNLPA